MGSQLPPKRGTATQFSAHVYCGQTAGWMKTPLGTEVNLGPGHIVLDEDPAPPPRKGALPLFGPCLLWPRSPVSATAELLFAQLICVSPVGAVDWITVNNNSAVVNICIIIQQELRSCWDGRRFGHNRQGPKSGAALPLSVGSWVPDAVFP